MTREGSIKPKNKAKAQPEAMRIGAELYFSNAICVEKAILRCKKDFRSGKAVMKSAKSVMAAFFAFEPCREST